MASIIIIIFSAHSMRTVHFILYQIKIERASFQHFPYNQHNVKGKGLADHYTIELIILISFIQLQF